MPASPTQPSCLLGEVHGALIRILFTFVTVIAVILAAMIQHPAMWGGAGASLVALAIAGVLPFVRKQRAKRKKVRDAKKARTAVSAVPEPEDVDPTKELEALGILDIRPREEGNGHAPSGDGPPSPQEEPRHSSEAEHSPEATPGPKAGHSPEATPDPSVAAKPEPVAVRTPSSSPILETASAYTPRKTSQKAWTSVDESIPASLRMVLTPYMEAFQSSIRANTVCLLRQPDEKPVYRIQAVATLNAYTRKNGVFRCKNPLLGWYSTRSGLQIYRACENTLTHDMLGYYREQIAVQEIVVAIVPIPSSDAIYALLADAMREQTLNSRETLGLISDFAHLLGAVIENESKNGWAGPLSQKARPRREIIDEEIKRSNEKGTPLALALVYLNKAEEVAERGKPAIAQTEASLRTHLYASAQGTRIERFGELTFGVFLREEAANVEAWAERVQQNLEHNRGNLEGGVSIGIALHVGQDDPDYLRESATRALCMALESSMCTIVE